MHEFVGRKDTVLVKALKDEGAIAFCRSNIPQYVFVGHTENEIFGRAKNPYDEIRTSGGSSGGEGTLVSSKCSPFGLGSDIGGSIRAPAATCGVVGFKGTPQRGSIAGAMMPIEGFSSHMNPIKCALGPICKTVKDVKTFCEIAYSNRVYNLDTSVPPVPFNQQKYDSMRNKKAIKIGFL